MGKKVKRTHRGSSNRRTSGHNKPSQRQKRGNRSGKKKIIKSRLFLMLFIVFIFFFAVGRLVWTGHKNAQAKKALEEAQNQKSIEVMEEKKRNVINVAIDAAKGGINEGMTAYRGSHKEKDINLEIAKFIKDNLSGQEDINVIMVRAYDEDKKLADRVAYAKKNQADLYISVRLSAQSGRNDASGIDTYYISPENIDYSSLDKSKEESASKDIKTNSSSNELVGKDDINEKSKSEKEKTIKPERDNLSKLLAENIQNTTISYIEMRDRGILDKKFDILNYTQMPAVIVQCGFISNKDDAEKLENEKYQQDIAQGISEGILKFVDENRKAIIKDRINYR